MSAVKFDTWNSSDGTLEFYKCRAWVNFKGTGTVAIRESGNVDSITDNGTGDYTVNFTNDMPDANYAFSIQTGGVVANEAYTHSKNAHTTLVGSIRVRVRNSSNALGDTEQVSVTVFR